MSLASVTVTLSKHQHRSHFSGSENMIDYINLCTFAWTLGFSAIAAYRILLGNRSSILFLVPVHFLFCGIPPLLDSVIGRPVYEFAPGFYLASRDDLTCLVYSLYVCAVPVVWYKTGWAGCTGRSSSLPGATVLPTGAVRLRLLFLGFLISPLALLCFAPEPSVYLTYGASAKELMNDELTTYHSYIAVCCILSLIGFAGTLFILGRMGVLPIACLAPFAAASAWIQGKRSIVFAYVVVTIYVYYIKGILTGRRLLVVCILSAITLSLFSMYYQRIVRSEITSLDSFEQIYDNVRTDYGRDNTIKLVIYSELHPNDLRILEYPFQNILFDLTFFVPRSMWKNKPWTYAIYVTWAMQLRQGDADTIRWGVTTSWLDEALATFSWFGLLIGPGLFSVLCRLGDKSDDMITRALSVLNALLLYTVQLPAFLPLFFLWLAAIFRSYRRHGHAKEIPLPLKRKTWSTPSAQQAHF